MKLEQVRTPLFDAVLNHAKKKTTSFHTPGHKNGRSIDKRFKNFAGENIFFMDVTVFDEVDSLHDPRGPLKEAQMLTAEAFGVKHSFFLINGSTSGIQAMFMSACNPGDEIIISRNIHKSVISGIILSGTSPIYVKPCLHKSLNILYNLSSPQVEEELEKHPDVKAVFVTSPTYHGICTDIKKIAKITHKYKKLLLVDEAWGPHLKFHKDFPVSAIDAGADIVVQSAHKVGSAMSQGSLLHVNSNRVDINRVKKIISMLQSTSPSYITLASLDLARKQLATEGEFLLNKLINLIKQTVLKINNIKGISCLTKKDLKDGYSLDCTKLSINVAELGLSGYEVSKFLNEKYNIQVDCENFYNLIAITGLGTTKDDLEKLVFALTDISKKYSKGKELVSLPPLSFETEKVLNPSCALTKKLKKINLLDAVGMISAEIISLYPPGIPVIVPGERITEEVCEYLKELSKINVGLKGKQNSLLRQIDVVSED